MESSMQVYTYSLQNRRGVNRNELQSNSGIEQNKNIENYAEVLQKVFKYQPSKHRTAPF